MFQQSFSDLILTFCRWVENTSFSEIIGESTWAVPIIGAIHVLVIALFGGTILIPDSQLRNWRKIGLIGMILTGILLFWSQPVHLYTSIYFKIKLAILLVMLLRVFMPRTKATRAISLALWVVIIFVSRGIAFK